MPDTLHDHNCCYNTGTSDFFGLNFYTGDLVVPDPDNPSDLFPPTYNSDRNIIESKDQDWVG